MATDSFIQLTTDGTGKQLDTALFNMGAGSTAVHREKMIIADPVTTGGFAAVSSSLGLQVQSTQATNPWSSAPGFNVPIVTVSSGLVQISGVPSFVISSSAALATVAVVSASSGLVQVSGTPLVNIVGTSSGVSPATTSGGLLVTAIQSSVYTVTATAATNPWSSAPGFNIPVVSVSSGLVQISGVPSFVISSSAALATVAVVNTSSGLVQISGTVGLSTAASANLISIVTSSAGNLVATTSQGLMTQQTTSKIVPVLQASSGVTSIDLWQASSRMSPTFVVATTISNLSSSPGNLFMVTGFTTSTGGIGASTPSLIRFYNATTSNVVMNTGIQCILPLGMQSSSTSLAGQGDIATPLMLANLGPIGIGFGTACSFDIVQTATSTGTVTSTASPAYITATYSTL